MCYPVMSRVQVIDCLCISSVICCHEGRVSLFSQILLYKQQQPVWIMFIDLPENLQNIFK